MFGAYVRLLAAQVRSQTQYRTSFVIDLAGSMVLTVLDVVSVFVIFSVKGDLGGFGAREVLLMVGISALAFPLADLAVGNVERLRVYVRTGMFDAVLVRPLSALWQLVAMDFAPRRVGRAVQGIAIYVVALAVAPVDWSVATALLAVLAPLAGAVFFASLFVAGATVAFWWIESGEIANGLTYGGLNFTQYPITIYGALFRRLFAYAVGFAFVAYYPTLALVDRPDPLGAPAFLGYAAPAIAVMAAVAAGLAWQTGVRHYRSTGS